MILELFVDAYIDSEKINITEQNLKKQRPQWKLWDNIYSEKSIIQASNFAKLKVKLIIMLHYSSIKKQLLL